MNIFENDRYSVHIIDMEFWDVESGGITGQWKIDQFGNIQIQCWYEWEVTKWIFWKYKKRYTTWIDEDDVLIADKYDPKIPRWKHFVNGIEI